MISKRTYIERKKIKVGIYLALAFLALAVAMPWSSIAEAPAEYQIKAAFIHHIAKFVQWPVETLVDAEEPFVLYIMGEDRFGNAFDSFEGRTIHNRSLSVNKIEAWEDIPVDCRILFVGIAERAEARRVLDKVAGKAVLTISDEPGFTELGGIVGLITVDNKVRFTVNRSSAAKGGLMLSSNLLKLAQSLQGDTL